MSSVEYLREFVKERLSAAAEEIFGVFKTTIFEYQEEVDRQRRLLDIVWKPEIKLQRIELPQQHVCKEEEEEFLSEQQLCIQERSSGLDQEDPEPPQIKEEREELCTSQEGEELELKQEAETFMLTPCEESALYFSKPEPTADQQLLSYISHVVESPDQEGSEHEDSESTRNAEPGPKKRHKKNTSHCDVNLLKIRCTSQTGKAPFQCDTCGKAFQFRSYFYEHMTKHTSEKPFCCKDCGKRFSYSSTLKAHIRIHTNEKLYSCKTCGKDFGFNSHLTSHMRMHTGEKPFSCKICGKDFGHNGNLLVHMRTHTGEKPFCCTNCGKRFSQTSTLKAHIRIHTGELYSCKTCAKDFVRKSQLTSHMKTHTGEKSFSCQTCGKDFGLNGNLLVHIRRAHTGEKPYLYKT